MTREQKIATSVKKSLFDRFDELNDFDVMVEPDYEKRDAYFCEVWAYSDDAVVNDICVTVKGYDDEDITKDISLELYRKIAQHRRESRGE